MIKGKDFKIGIISYLAIIFLISIVVFIGGILKKNRLAIIISAVIGLVIIAFLLFLIFVLIPAM